MKRYLKAALGVMLLFSVGLVGYYQFSADKGDGLETTLEKAGWNSEKEYYRAPLNYGETYPTSLLMGILGSLTVGVVIYVAGKMFLRRTGC